LSGTTFQKEFIEMMLTFGNLRLFLHEIKAAHAVSHQAARDGGFHLTTSMLPVP
jgi:hypothetical protein